MIKSILFALAAGVSAAFSVPALSQAEDDSRYVAANIAGEWSFIANTGPECQFTGNALLTATEDPRQYACELTAYQVCSTETWQVRQSCTAFRDGDEVVINSRIEEFIQGEAGPSYRRDNFKLTIISSDKMIGSLVSWGYHSAVFMRSEGTIS